MVSSVNISEPPVHHTLVRYDFHKDQVAFVDFFNGRGDKLEEACACCIQVLLCIHDVTVILTSDDQTEHDAELVVIPFKITELTIQLDIIH